MPALQEVVVIVAVERVSSLRMAEAEEVHIIQGQIRRIQQVRMRDRDMLIYRI